MHGLRALRTWCRLRDGCLLLLRDPCVDFVQVPGDGPRRDGEALGEFSGALEFKDCALA